MKLVRNTAIAMAAIVLVGLASPLLTPLLRFSAADAGRAPAPDVAASIEELGTIRIGAKNFNEQYILADVLERRLAETGFDVETSQNLGSTVAFNALSSGNVDVYVEYSGTVWANYMGRTHVPPREVVLDEVAYWLAAERGVRMLGPIGFENAYGLAMRREHTDELGIRTIADLADHAGDLVLGADLEYLERPEEEATRDAYGLDFEATKSFAPTLMYDAIREGEVDVITAFTSDGRIAAYDLVVLKDPKRAIPPYDAILLLSPRVAHSRGLVETLAPLINAVPQDTMIEANQRVDVEGREVSAVASWLYEKTLIHDPSRTDSEEDIEGDIEEDADTDVKADRAPDAASDASSENAEQQKDANAPASEPADPDG